MSLAILFTTEGFFPNHVDGDFVKTTYKDFNSVLPLLSFIVSLLASSFGMSKFFLAGPIQFLPIDSAFNGVLSIPFLILCLINSMFGIRIICIESAFFSTYNYQIWNKKTHSYDQQQIAPIITPEYRLVVYLAPCIIPFLINVIKLWSTTEGLWTHLMKYPQFLISPCFTPFIFEGYKSTNQPRQYKLKIWKWGSIINAIYIGCLPQCILCVTDYYKGIHQWEFGKHVEERNEFRNITDPLTDISHRLVRKADEDYENNNALFKSNYGNTVFAIITASLFLTLIAVFFGSGTLFKEKGIHCRCLTILCCPFPNPCINISEPELESKVESTTPVEKPKNEVYWYTRRGETKIRLLGSTPEKRSFKSQVSLYLQSVCFDVVILMSQEISFKLPCITF